MQDVEPPAARAARLRRAATGALLAIAGAGARAASFDCQRARLPTEIAICASPQLSALDDRMASTYERGLQALSPEGASQLKDSQRGWLRFAIHACERRPPTLHANTLPPVNGECLAAEFKDRIAQLDQAGLRVGPYVFNRVDRFEGRPNRTDDDTGGHPGVVTLHVGYPQIDSPRTAATTAWNASQRLALPASDSEDDTDEDRDSTLGCVGERFISVATHTSEYRHGAAHGTFGQEVRNALLVPAVHKMTAADVFAAGSGWQGKLPTLFWRIYLGRGGADKRQPELEQAIRETAADPDRWLLTPQGVQIRFDAYEGGACASNPGPLTLPWSEIGQMLATPDLTACQAPPARRP